MQKNILKIIAAMLALSLVLVACSDSKDDEKSEKKSDTSMTKDDAMDKGEDAMDMGEDAMKKATMSIAEIAVADPENFSTLVSLATSAGLVDLLSNEGTITLFAPTNEAFSKVPAATLDALGKNPEALKQVLTYHAVTASAVESSALSDGQIVETAEGSKLAVGVKDGKVTIRTDTNPAVTVNVTTADVKATNGVIHVIDGVLIPAGLKL